MFETIRLVKVKCLHGFCQFIDSTTHGMLDHFQTGIIEFFNEAQDSRQQIGALKRRSKVVSLSSKQIIKNNLTLLTGLLCIPAR